MIRFILSFLVFSGEKSPSGSPSPPSPPGLRTVRISLVVANLRSRSQFHLIVCRILSMARDPSIKALCAVNDRFILFKISKVFCV